MYLPYWEMKTRPFENGFDPAFYLPVESASLSIAKIRYVVSERLGAMCLLGPAGIGKSALLHLVLSELNEAGYQTAYVPSPGGNPHEMLMTIGAFLDLGANELAGAPLLCLEQYLCRKARDGKGVCLVIDEAHTAAGPEILEALRLLTNFTVAGTPAFSLILSGQGKLQRMLEKTSDFASRMAMMVSLPPLTLDECKRYVLYRLKVAGCHRGIFTRHAAEDLWRYSRGIPRQINRLCELALLSGFGMGEKKITPEIVRMAADELGLSKTKETRKISQPAAEKQEDVLRAATTELRPSKESSVNTEKTADAQSVISQVAEVPSVVAVAEMPEEEMDAEDVLQSMAAETEEPAVITEEGEVDILAGMAEELSDENSSEEGDILADL